MTIEPEEVGRLTAMLERFVQGEDRSKAFAGEIEVLLDELFEDDPRFEDLILALASYEPGGGEYLFDAAAITALCNAALTELTRQTPAP